jgi:hypothetical protein
MNTTQPSAVDAPVAYGDRYSAKVTDFELLQRAQKGAQLMAARAAEQAETIRSVVQQAEDALNLLAFQTVQARGEEQGYVNYSGDAWTPAQSAELHKRLQQAVVHEDDSQLPAAQSAPSLVADTPFNAFIETIGQPKRVAVNDKAGAERKPRKKKVLVASSTVGALTILAISGPMLTDMNKPAEAPASKPVSGASPEVIEAIEKKKYPDITPASIALGQCLADGPGLFSGHASGASSEAWVFKAADGTLRGAQTADQKYLPIEVQSAPFDVAACAPADTRAAMVTMKDATITIDKSKVAPEIRMAIGGTVTPTIQEFVAAPEVGLTDAGAKALNAAQLDKANKDSAATIAYANLARAIAKKDSVELGRVEAQMDTDLLQSVNDQIAAFYKKQGKDAPVFNLTLTGDYLDAKVIDPATLPDILTKTKDTVRLTPSTLTALDFSTLSTTTPTPSEK